MQLVFISFKKKIYNAATPTQLIAAGDTVNVRLRAGCGSCIAASTGPNVSDTANGCDNLNTLSANSDYVLGNQDPIVCVGEVVPLVVESVTADGRGFTYDRTAAGQDYRASDIDMVMPDHDGVGCDGGSSAGSVVV